MTDTSDAAILAAARRLVAQETAATELAAAEKRAQEERLEVALKMALVRNEGDIDGAVNLFLRWCEADSDQRKLLELVTREALEKRLAETQTKDA